MNETIVLTIPARPGLLGVATLVLGGIGTRLHLPYEQVDDLQLAALSALAATDGETVTLEVSTSEDELEVRVGPVASGSAGDAGLRRVLERLVDGVGASERDGQEWLTLRLERRQPA